MHIVKETVLDVATFCADGSIEVRMQKRVVGDGVVVWQEPHRTVIDPFVSVDDQMAPVAQHLATMGFSGLTAEALDRLSRMATIQRASPAVQERMAKLAESRSTD